MANLSGIDLLTIIYLADIDFMVWQKMSGYQWFEQTESSNKVLPRKCEQIAAHFKNNMFYVEASFEKCGWNTWERCQCKIILNLTSDLAKCGSRRKKEIQSLGQNDHHDHGRQRTSEYQKGSYP